MEAEPPQQHLLVIAFELDGHINPSLQLAKNLTSLGVRVTFSTTVSAHRLMFPGNASFPVDDALDPLLSYYPFSDGYDDGCDVFSRDMKEAKSTLRCFGSRTLHAIATDATRPPITCMVYSFIFPWVADVANSIGVPSVLYWIQSAAVLTLYHHYCHDHRELITSHLSVDDTSLPLQLPGLPPLKSQDLPSFLRDDLMLHGVTNKSAMSDFEEMFQLLEKGAKIMANTFHELERETMEAISQAIEIIPVGPILLRKGIRSSKSEDSLNCWLDKWPDRSVVYLSFGSISRFSNLGKNQHEEFARALVECERPFLWVARGEVEGLEEAVRVERGKVVEWCQQLEVLQHKAVGCFVTHHGWNSTLEAITCGVPMVGLPTWSDQPTNSRLVESLWRVGVRAEVNGDGIVKESELKRCLEMVMGDGEVAVEIRRRAETLGEKAREATKQGGSSDQNLKAFIRMT